MKEYTKRAFSRNNYEAPIRFASYDELKYTDAKMYNSSMGGMYFEADNALLPESNIHIKMKKYMPKTHDPEAFKAYKAKVKWCNKIDKADASCFGIGVQYIDESHVDREVSMNLLKRAIRKLVPKKKFLSPKDILSSFPNASILDSVLIKDSDSEFYAPTDNTMYDFFLKSTSSDLHKYHHYFEIYHLFFNRFKQKKNIKVLEIGIAKGGSLNLWRQYFDESAIIVGVDINHNTQRFENKDARTFVRIGDQASSKFLNKIVDEFREFDIIIDDGGHTTNQQITSFIHLYDSLSKDGIYLVEDTHSNYWQKFQDRKDGITFIDLAKNLVDLLHDPYQSMSIGYPFRVDNPSKLREIRVSKFYSETKSICFFDSIVVFTKGKRAFPRNEIR